MGVEISRAPIAWPLLRLGEAAYDSLFRPDRRHDEPEAEIRQAGRRSPAIVHGVRSDIAPAGGDANFPPRLLSITRRLRWI